MSANRAVTGEVSKDMEAVNSAAWNAIECSVSYASRIMAKGVTWENDGTRWFAIWNAIWTATEDL